MRTRIADSYPVWHEPEPLALYRLGTRSLSSSALRTGENGSQLIEVIETNRGRLSPAQADQLTATALRVTATTAIRRRVRLARLGDIRGALTQLPWSLRADSSPRKAALAGVGLAGAALAAARARQSRQTDPARWQ